MGPLAAVMAVMALAVACGGDAPAAAVSATVDGLAREQARLPQPAELEPERARALRGRYATADRWVEIFGTGGRLYLRTDGIAAAPLVEIDGGLEAVSVTAGGIPVEIGATGGLVVDGVPLDAETDRPRWRPGAGWAELLGRYARDGAAAPGAQLILHERRGRPYVEIAGVLLLGGDPHGDRIVLDRSPLGEEAALLVRRDADGDVSGLQLGDMLWRRVPVGTPPGETFRIDPVTDIDELRRQALAADPPVEEGDFAEPDLVPITAIEPGIRLDVRYAGTDNFMGAVFYRQEAAFLQRPAAEAVARAHRSLAAVGFGLLVHDAYRPWHVTKMFWDATPEHQRRFVADPAAGSRHNRGAAVDLTLYDLDTGEPAVMTGGYDEFSSRSYPDHVGGTSLQRWRRDLLRRAMEAEGFDVYEFEWWHFDYRDWRRYPILDLTFEELSGPSDW